MRPQLDLRPGGLMLALGAVGLGGAWTASAEAGLVAATAGRTSAPAPVAPAPPGALAGGNGLPAMAVGLGIPAGGALAPLIAPVRATGSNVAISASTRLRNLLVGRPISVYGNLRPDTRSRVVSLQARRGSGWVTILQRRTGRSGEYNLDFTPPAPATLALRVEFAGDRLSRSATAVLGAVNVYRRAQASWYGPGGPLACGGTLTDSRLGVAHRTLPCGTLVRLHLGNRTVRVPVIDRGPYVTGREYDLTPATKRALGFGDTGEVWATR